MIWRFEEHIPAIRAGSSAIADLVVETALAACCPVCSAPFGEHRFGVCCFCWEAISRIGESSGWQAHRKMSCRGLDSMTALGPYEGRLGRIIRCLKFGDMPALAAPLGEMLAMRLGDRAQSGLVVPVASKGGLGGGLDIHQDVTITATKLSPNGEIVQPISSDRHTWVQVVCGSGAAGEVQLEPGDGLAISNETELVLVSHGGMEVLTFDLA